MSLRISDENVFRSLTEKQTKDLKFEFNNIVATAEALEELTDGINLPSTMDVLNMTIFEIQKEIKSRIEDRSGGLEYLIDKVTTISNLMTFFANVHSQIGVLTNYTDYTLDLLNQQNTKGGSDHDN